MLHLPYSQHGCQKGWHYHHPSAARPHVLMSNGCDAMKTEALLTLLSSTDLAATLGEDKYGENIQSLAYYTPRYWKPLVAALIAGTIDPEGTGSMCLSYDDLHCNTCDHYVSKVLDRRHWDTLCASCYNHSDECECCTKCGYEDGSCICCPICQRGPSWDCSCCSYCDQTEDNCECDVCDNCESKLHHCSCSGNDSSAYSFGETKVAPWTMREDNPMDTVLPRIGECQNSSIDPVQAAADFYLLDAIKGMVRMANLTGGDQERFWAQRNGIIEHDSMLSALQTSADRSYRKLVDHLAPNFLAYAIAAVGGELRYHRATSKVQLPTSRDKAWDAFTGIVETKGAETLFEADKLFLEFGGGAYGGKKWGDAAKVVGMYLKGTIPAWLFVDRAFTLQHNGGCFFNKVSWAKRNDLKWGLTNILYVLNAHAGKTISGGEAETGTDWKLLLEVASPNVRDMFTLAEKSIARIGRRYGMEITPIARKSPLRLALDWNAYSYSH